MRQVLGQVGSELWFPRPYGIAAHAEMQLMLISYCIHTVFIHVCSAVAVYILHCSVRWKYAGIYASYTLFPYFFAAHAGIILLVYAAFILH